MRSTGRGSRSRCVEPRGNPSMEILAGLAPQERPLQALPRTALITRFQAALRSGDGSEGAHCIHELWVRGELAQSIETALEHLWRRAAATIPEWLPMQYVSWLPAAYDVAARFRPCTKGRSNIYLVLLDYSDRRGDSHGVYVGMSRYSPAQRFDQHKARYSFCEQRSQARARGARRTDAASSTYREARSGGHRSRPGRRARRCRHTRRGRTLNVARPLRHGGRSRPHSAMLGPMHLL